MYWYVGPLLELCYFMELVSKHHSRPHHYKRVAGDPVTLIHYPIALVFVCVIDVSEHRFPRTLLALRPFQIEALLQGNYPA